MFNRFFGILLMGIVIKVMDDYFDKEIDKESKQWNINILLGRSILPYSLLIAIISLYLNFTEAAAVFAASYTIGMLHTYRGILPTKIYGWQEGFVILLIFSYILSFREIIVTIIIVGIIQLIDDMLDYKKEKFINQNNIINKIGIFNTILSTFILLFIAIKFFPLKFNYFFIAAVVVHFIFLIIRKFSRTVYND